MANLITANIVLKEDAHLILGVYVLLNDDEHGEDEIAKQLHDASETTVLNIRFFIITFLHKVRKGHMLTRFTFSWNCSGSR